MNFYCVTVYILIVPNPRYNKKCYRSADVKCFKLSHITELTKIHIYTD